MYSGVLLVIAGDGQERNMTLTNSSLLRYVKDNNLSSIAHNGQALEEKIMSTCEISVTVNEDGVVSHFGEENPEHSAHAAEADEDLAKFLSQVFE